MKSYHYLIVSLLFCLANTQKAFGTKITFCTRECFHSNTCPEVDCRTPQARIVAKSRENIRWELLNLKASAENINTAIEITQTDILNIAVAGNSWVKYTGLDANMVMDIGVANSSSPQAWVLPNNFHDYIDEYSQYDFISPTSVPVSLRLNGTTHVTKSLGVDRYGNDVDVFDHYIINASDMNHIGTSFDLETTDDDVFDEPDFEFMNVPLSLGNIINTAVEEKNFVSNLALNRMEVTLTIDAFGTLSIPNIGTVNCLRGSYVIKNYKRVNESSPFVLQTTQNAIGFFSKQGHLFYGGVASMNGTTATFGGFAFQTVIPTHLLTEPTDVKLNNDSRGVTINTSNQSAHPSAVLDISSDSLGVLIPRISKANRPSNPAEGLLVYQVDNTPGFYYFNGTSWQRLAQTTPSPGRIAAPDTEKEQGSETLAGGVAFIKFDQPHDDFESLIINIQLEGECNGVYISKKTREGFEVRELQKGRSNAKFSWQIN